MVSIINMCIDDNAGNLYVVVQEISFNSAVWIARMLYFSVDWLHDICKAVEFRIFCNHALSCFGWFCVDCVRVFIFSA